MAVEGEITNDVKFYHSFVGFMKWGTIISFGLGAFVVLLIAS